MLIWEKQVNIQTAETPNIADGLSDMLVLLLFSVWPLSPSRSQNAHQWNDTNFILELYAWQSSSQNGIFFHLFGCYGDHYHGNRWSFFKNIPLESC